MTLKLEVGVAKVEGDEACKFLHAIVSSDVQALQQGKSQASLLLTPSGKVISCFWIYRSEENSYLLVMEKELFKTTLETLSRFLIRTKATIDDVSALYVGDVVFSEEAKSETSLLIEPKHLNQDAIELYIDESDGKEISSEDTKLYESLRISYGAVSCAKDLAAEIIPQEAHLDKNAVSFSKGCYLGQELVCRIDSREASTPFSFYAVNESIALPDELITTSKTQQGIPVKDGIVRGPYSRIIRVPRKLTKEIEAAGAVPVSGYFSS